MAAESSYYGKPILKGQIWQDYIAAYFFIGGLAGASATLGIAARARRNDALARSCTFSAAGGATISAALLIADLGNPARFLNMLRVVKVTSPMNLGTWLLTAFGITSGIAAASEIVGSRNPMARFSRVAAGVLGLPLATYTAVLIADTATPVWHEAHAELPFVFATSAAVSAGAWNSLFVPHRNGAIARRLLVLAGTCELVARRRMVRNLGPLLGEPYRTGRAGKYAKVARTLTVSGVITTVVLGKRSRWAATLGALAALSGALCERFSIFYAGRQSALDPKYVVEHQAG